MNDFLGFRKMITPIIIQIIFWLGTLAIVVLAIWTIARGADSYDGSSVIVALGFVLLLFGPFVWRMYCEMLILNFRIHSTLTDIYHKVDRLGEKKDVTETKG